MSDQTVEIRITAKNLTAKEFAEARKEISGLGDAARKESSAMGGVFKTAIGTRGGFMGATAIMNGVATAFRFAKDAAIGMNASLETTRLKFTTLMGDSDLARKHVADLFEFAKKTPFETGPIIEASLKLQTFGGEALNTKDNLTLLGNASAATGAPIQELGMWTGRLYAMLQAGKPFGEAAMRLQELAVLTPQARDQMERLQQSGASANEIFGVFQKSLGGFNGAMEAQANTWAGVTSTIMDSVTMLVAEAFAPFFEILKEIGKMLAEGLETDKFSATVKFISGLVIDWTGYFLTLGKVATQVFSGILAIGSGLGAVMSGTLSVISGGIAKMLELASHLPGVGGHLKGLAFAANEATTFFKGLTGDYIKNAQAAGAAALGGGQVGAVFDRLQAVVDRSRQALDGATDATNTHTGSMKNSAVAVAQSNKVLDEYNKKLRDLSQVLTTVGANADPKLLTQQYGKAIKDIVEQATLLGQKVPESIRQAFLKVTLTEAGAHIAAEVEKINKEIEEKQKATLAARNDAISKNLSAAVDAHRTAEDLKNKASLNSFEYQKTLIERERDAKIAALDETAFGYQEALAAIAAETDAKMGDAERAWKEHLAEMEAATNSWGNLVRGWMQSIPDLLSKAFTGGGGFAGGMKALTSGIGGDIGDKLFGGPNGLGNKLAQGLLGKGAGAGLAGTLGNMVGMIGGPIGSMLGGLAMKGIGALGGKLKDVFGGPSKKEMEGRDAAAQIREQLSATLTEQQKLEAGGAKWKEEIIAVREAFVQSGRSADDALKVVDALHKAEKQGPEAVVRVYNEQIVPAMQAVQEQKQQEIADQERANELMSKYGISIEETGGKFRNARMKEIGEGLVTDFTDLVGILDLDMDTAIGKMGASMNDFIGKALKTGTEVPAAMKPMLERMIELGQLTDADGNKIESLEGSGISFSESVTEGFGKVVDRMDALLKGLGIEFPAAIETAAGASQKLSTELQVTGEAGAKGIQRIKDAIAGLPRDINVQVNGEWNPPDDMPGDSGSGIPGHALGGVFSTPHIARIAEGGRPEIVGDRSFMAGALVDAFQALGAVPGKAGGNNVVFNLTTFAASADPIRQLVHREIGPLLIEWISGNKGGSQTELRAALGIT